MSKLMAKADSSQYKINLLSRVACLGSLKSFDSECYSGPLERSLLTFAWMINAVRVSLRDLIETITVCMFLSGVISRERSDWSQLAVGYVLLVPKSVFVCTD